MNSECFWDIDSNFHAIYLYYYIYFSFFLFSLVFLGFLIYPGSEPLAGDSKPDDLRAPDEKTSLGLKDSSKQGHKTKGNYLIFVHRFKCE